MMAEQPVRIIDGQAKEEKTRRLHRSSEDRIVLGVSAGLGEYFGVDAGLVRLGWVVASLFTLGGAVLVYGLLAVVLPDESGEHATVSQINPKDWWQRLRGNSVLLWGIILLFVGGLLLVNNFGLLPFRLGWIWDTFWALFWPLLLIGVGVVLLLPVFGKNVDLSRAREVGASLPMRRSRKERVVAGVCGGLARKLRIDPMLVRLVWAVLTIFTAGALGVLLYALAWVFIPVED